MPISAGQLVLIGADQCGSAHTAGYCWVLAGSLERCHISDQGLLAELGSGPVPYSCVTLEIFWFDTGAIFCTQDPLRKRLQCLPPSQSLFNTIVTLPFWSDIHRIVWVGYVFSRRYLIWCLGSASIAGFRSRYCELNVDECELEEAGINPCKNGATCLDQVNGFVCHCPSGFTGNFHEIHR